MSGWYVKRNDQKYGPYTSTRLVEMAKKGQVLPIDWVAKDDSDQWMPASQVKGLFAASPQETVAAAPVADPSPAPADAFAFDAGSASDIEGTAGTSGFRAKRKARSSPIRLSKPILAAIAGCVLFVIVAVVYFATRGPSKPDGTSSAGNVANGGDREMKERTTKSRLGGESWVEKAFKITGEKKNPSFKPASPGSVQDFFDAFGMLCEQMHNVPLRPGAKVGCYLKPPGCPSTVWHDLFGEPERLPKGRERIGKVENEFERWRIQCTDGSVTAHGQIIVGGGKTYYSPRSINVD